MAKVDLVDLTKLISVSMGRRSPASAEARAGALRTSFLALLDGLRLDEIRQRDDSFRTILGGYKARLPEARQWLIKHQAQTGLVSLDRYGVMVASLERLRDQQRDVDDRLAQNSATVADLTRPLGTTAELAAHAMVLRSDPQFQALLDTLAKQDTEIATLGGTRAQGQSAAAGRGCRAWQPAGPAGGPRCRANWDWRGAT